MYSVNMKMLMRLVTSHNSHISKPTVVGLIFIQSKTVLGVTGNIIHTGDFLEIVLSATENIGIILCVCVCVCVYVHACVWPGP